MKVGIITINGNNNYGNRLQNYAVQEVLKSLGCQVETIVKRNKARYKKPHRNFVEAIEHIKEKNAGKSWDYLKFSLYRSINKKMIAKYQENRVKAFKLFTSRYISETEYMISEANIPDDINQIFDFFVTGSDQVWNPYYRRTSPIDFLTFAPKHKRIAYAPSFGVSNIPSVYRLEYTTWLSEMRNLSVREEAGAKIIKDLTGREAPVLVDPTLMLSKKKWLSIGKVSSLKPRNQYLLTYFLGRKTEIHPTVKKIAEENDLEIVNLSDITSLKYYCIDPAEFIDLIYSANVFFTDSFHGAAFSILLEKPFVVFDRKGGQSMSSRIDTLLSTFRLESRKWKFMTNNNDLFCIDYTHVPAILENERNKALNYLKNALDL